MMATIHEERMTAEIAALRARVEQAEQSLAAERERREALSALVTEYVAAQDAFSAALVKYDGGPHVASEGTTRAVVLPEAIEALGDKATRAYCALHNAAVERATKEADCG